MSASTRRKVLAAAEKLGYHVNHLARGLIQDRSDIVCLIVTDLQAPDQAAMLEAVTRHLQEIGKVVMVLNSEGQPGQVEAALRQTLNYRADATVMMSGTPPAPLIDTCIDNGQRVILINRDDKIDRADHIMIDNEAASREACLMLQRAGCARLAVVSSSLATTAEIARERAFVATAEEIGLPVTICRAGPASYATGMDSARRLLAPSSRPQGVFCVSDLLALGFIDAARQDFKLTLPVDLCVIGFGDIPAAGWLGYDLTTFRPPIDEICRHIADLLSPEDRGAQRRIFPVQVVWRRSLRP